MRKIALTFALALMPVAVACSGGGGASPTTRATQGTVTSTPTGPLLHLSAGVFAEGTFRRVLEELFANASTRGNCPSFLALSDLGAGQRLEAENNRINASSPHLTPVAADEARAGQILKEVCRQLASQTPTAAPTAR